jgi:tetratricopeptide (TPR) repeat protein
MEEVMRRVGWHELVSVCFAVATMLAAFPTRAQTQDETDWCFGERQKFSLDLQVKGCTAIIQAPGAPVERRTAAYLVRGHAYYMEKQYDRAIADLDQVVKLEPKMALPIFLRGSARLRLKDYDGAIADITRAIELEPRNAAYYWDRALAYAAKGDSVHAISDCGHVLDIDPDNSSALYLRGLLKVARGDQSGNADIARARQINPQIGTSAPDNAACVDLPGAMLGMFVREGPTVLMVVFGRPNGPQQIALIKLDCSLTADEWFKLGGNLPRHVCKQATLSKPRGGECKVIEVTPLSGSAPDAAKYDTVVRLPDR